MRGRLRVDGRVFGENPTWLEVPDEFWTKRLPAGADLPMIPEPILAPGAETPAYGEDSRYFTLKVHYGGKFDDNVDSYVGGQIRYFDMCEVVDFCLTDMESMLIELGLVLGDFCLWFCIPDTELVKGLMPIVTDDEVSSISVFTAYSRCLNIYTTDEPLDGIGADAEWDDFSLTQLEEDQRIERIEEIREEVGYVGEAAGDNEGVEPPKKEEEKLSWEGDNSNIDSSDSEVEKLPPKRRRIPPPNPPYRTRKRGRYSMLRGLFKNTEDTPVIITDEDGPPASQPSEVQQKADEKLKALKGKMPMKTVKKTPVKKKTTVARKKTKPVTPEIETSKGDEAEEKVEDEPPEKVEGVDEQFEESDELFGDTSSESSYHSTDERMAISSCDEEDSTFPEFNESIDMANPQFRAGMLFASGQIFRNAVRKHAIVNQRPIRLKKNLKDKIKWVCSGGCQWRCYGIKQQRTENIQIKTLINKHTCNPTWFQKCVNSIWIANEYEDEIRMNPGWATQAFRAKVINDLKCNVSLSMVYRALKKARDNILGQHEMEYAKIFAYANEIKRQMPASTVKIMTEQAEQGGTCTRFKRFYVCLDPLKEGFLDGCRPLIGLDGCHLKGPLGGIFVILHQL